MTTESPDPKDGSHTLPSGKFHGCNELRSTEQLRLTHADLSVMRGQRRANG